MEKINEKTISGYSSEFSENGFWSKIFGCAKKAGKKLVRMALELYYAYRSGNMSAMDKVMVVSALGYLISPIDLVPDAIPVLGFSDDLGALTLVYNKVSAAITEQVKAQAKRKCDDIFG